MESEEKYQSAKPDMNICKYIRADGYLCLREAHGDNPLCHFHFGWDADRDKAPPSNPDFAAAFENLIAAKDGDWRGFVLREGTKLPPLIDFPVIATGAWCHGLDLDGVTFQGPVEFPEAVFTGKLVLRNVTFETTANFEQSSFDGPVDFLITQSMALHLFMVPSSNRELRFERTSKHAISMNAGSMTVRSSRDGE